MASAFMCGVEDLLFNGSRFVWNFTITTLRRWYTDRLRACQEILRTWCGLRDVYQMTEGRHCQVILLDDRKLELLVQPKLLSRELLDLVASHFNLKEKEYFGIKYTDDIGQSNWLQLDHRVLDHDLPKKSGPVTMYFAVRFYIESIAFLKDNTTVELFFLNAKSCTYKGEIEIESETLFKLAAYVLQEAKGDYTSDENARTDLKKLPALPTKVLKEHPSLAYCEDRVIDQYKKLKNLTRGQTIVKYMTQVEALLTYGVHYYEVKDKQEIPWWLGISYKGIGQYDLQDKVKPRKFFQWKQLENLYFREKKFAVEVNDPRRVPLSRRTFGHSGLVVNTWYASPSLIKSIWVMAISQHQFYLDRKQSKAKIPSARSLGDIAMDLTDTGAPKNFKLTASVSKNQPIMASNGSLISAGSQDSEVSEEQRKEKIIALRKKEKALQETLAQKLEELKKICLREAELTGKLPEEYPLGPDEKPPQLRRRVGTAFKLDDDFLQNEEDPTLQNLESSFVIQQKVVEAERKLATEPDISKNVKRRRKQDYADALKKLQDLENAINEHRIKYGKKPTQRASLLVADDLIQSESSSLSDTTTVDDDDSREATQQRCTSVQHSPRPHPPQSLGIEQNQQRKTSTSELIYNKGPARYGGDNYPFDTPVHIYRDSLSTHSSPYRTQGRQHHGGKSVPTTPVLTRNAYSSSHLQSHALSQHQRQRSGSLESEASLLCELPNEKQLLAFSRIQRSNSTEVLDDRSSTSQSSTEYYSNQPNQQYAAQTIDYRTRDRRRYKRYISAANSGSMPNLAHKDIRNGVYQNSQNQPPPSFYVRGYSPYPDHEVYYNGGYVYENGTEGHYPVNPSNRVTYYGHDHYREHGHCYGDEVDSLSQNVYATLRPSKRTVARTEQKHFKDEMVSQELRWWYKRATSQKDLSQNLQAGFDPERGSQKNLSFPGSQAPFSPTSRATSFSSMSSAASTGTWRSQVNVGLPEYDTMGHPYNSGYGNVYSNTLPQNRYVEYSETNVLDSSQLENSLPTDEQVLYWHEDPKPGTLV
nr:PREDICTED: FERM domain-containing protein 4B [Latimeria chalumnae]|eukprot:XP_014343458.1 PREDICTED: FERM domain-containing protein 4B [Latimeria chalumnae]